MTSGQPAADFTVFLTQRWHDGTEYRNSMGDYSTGGKAMIALKQQMAMSPRWSRGVVWSARYNIDIISMINPADPDAYLELCADEDGDVMCGDCDCWKQTRAICG